MPGLSLDEGIGDLAFFKDLKLFLSLFSYRAQLCIVHAILQRGLGATFASLTFENKDLA